MLEATVIELAKLSVKFFLGNTITGGVQASGSDLYKSARDKLVGFFQYKFSGKPEFNGLESSPDDLLKLIQHFAESDKDFETELRHLVSELTQIERDDVQGLGDGSSVSGSNVAGDDSNITSRDNISQNKIEGSINFVGGHQEKSTFRF